MGQEEIREGRGLWGHCPPHRVVLLPVPCLPKHQPYCQWGVVSSSAHTQSHSYLQTLGLVSLGPACTWWQWWDLGPDKVGESVRALLMAGGKLA